MDKQTAIDILENIKETLNTDGIDRALKDVKIYRKGLKIATNEEIKKMITKHCEYLEKYGENHAKTIELDKKIGKLTRKIYNS